MSLMTPTERVWTALNHQEPDRVPLYEGTIEIPELYRGKQPFRMEPGILFFSFNQVALFNASWFRPLRKILFKIIQHPALLPPAVKPSVQAATGMHQELGIDMASFVGGIPMVFNPDLFDDVTVFKKRRVILSPSGDVATHDTGGGLQYGAVLRNGFLRSPEDYEKYIAFNPDHPTNTFMADEALRLTRGKIALVFSVFGAAFFETMCDMFGFETTFRLLVKDPRFVERVVKDMNDYSCAVAKQLAEKGVRLFYMSDDLGQLGRSLISPRMYKKFFFEGVRRFCDTVHSYGGKVMMHSCGNVMDLLPLIVDTGIDALHPWEPTAGMDIVKGKQELGDRLTLVGNVSLELLRSGTSKQVVLAVKELLTNCAPGGGYILSSQHSVLPTSQWQNYMAMLWAARKYGHYSL